MTIRELEDMSTIKISAHIGGYLVRYPVVVEEDGKSEVCIESFVCLNRDDIVRKLDVWLSEITLG